MFGKYTSPNTRQHKRLLADYLIKYRMAGTPNQEPFVSNIKDISAGGVRFWTEEALPEGALLIVEVMVPPLGRVIKAPSRVVRVREAGNGSIYYAAVRFMEISEDDQMRLNAFIERIAAENGTRSIVPDYARVQRKFEASFG